MSSANLLDGAVSVPMPKIDVKSGWVGQTTLVAGVSTFPVPDLFATDLIFLSAVTASANAGFLSVSYANAGSPSATVTITSSNLADTRTINYLALSPP